MFERGGHALDSCMWRGLYRPNSLHHALKCVLSLLLLLAAGVRGPKPGNAAEQGRPGHPAGSVRMEPGATHGVRCVCRLQAAGHARDWYPVPPHPPGLHPCCSLLAAYAHTHTPSRFFFVCRGVEGVAARTYLGVTIKVEDGLWLTARPRV